MDKIIITNNDKVYQKYKNKFNIVFLEERSYLDVLNETRDRVHMGCKILSHPMAGSLKPNQTPYKSIIIEKNADAVGTVPIASKVDYESIVLIENSLEAAYKFLRFRATPMWSEKILNDFKTVDLSLIENVVKNPMISNI